MGSVEGLGAAVDEPIPLMGVEPTSRTLVINATCESFRFLHDLLFQQDVAVFNPHHPKRSPTPQLDAEGFDAGQAPLERRAISVASRVLHEVEHLHRYLSTSYGFWHHYLRSQHIRWFFEDWSAAGSMASHPLYFPGPVREERTQRNLSVQEFLRCFAGDTRASDSDSQIKRGWQEYLTSLESYSALLPELERHPDEIVNGIGPGSSLLLGVQNFDDIDRFAGPKAATPFVSKRPFGARHLLETLAMSVEITFGSFAGARNPEWHDQLSISDYSLAWEAWEAFFPSPYVTSRVPDAWRSRILGDNRKSRPLEFYLAAELALWTPLGPGGVVADKGRPTSWWDVHPGWRFFLVMSYFRRTGLSFADPNTFPGSFEAIYEPLQNAVCDHYGWPTPRMLSERWQSFLLRVLTVESAQGYFIEVDSQRHRAAGSLVLVRTGRRWLRRNRPGIACCGDAGSALPLVTGKWGGDPITWKARETQKASPL